MIPPFDRATGNLPPGVHEATWDEIVARYDCDRDSGEPKGIVAIDLGDLP